MKVKYVGPFGAVEVSTSAPGQPVRWTVVKQGEAVEVDEAQGQLLCQQESNWQEIKTKKEGDK